VIVYSGQEQDVAQVDVLHVHVLHILTVVPPSLSALHLVVPLARLIAIASVGDLFVLLVVVSILPVNEIPIALLRTLSAFCLVRPVPSVLLVKTGMIATGSRKLLFVPGEPAWKGVTPTALALMDRSA